MGLAMAEKAGRFLRYRADRRTLGFALTWFGLVAYQWIVTPTSPVVALPLYAATLVLAFVGAVATHNVIHAPMFTRRWMNEAWRIVQTLWYGQPVSLFVPVHNHSHHKYAQTRKDLTRSTKVDHRWQLANLWYATGWQLAALRDCRTYLLEQRRQGKRIWSQFRTELAVLLVTFTALVALSPWRAVVYVAVPHAFGTFCIKAINFLQHDGCDYDLEGFDHSRNFTGRWFNWIFLNNGYHTLHHMRPGVHWSLLPEQHARLVRPRMHPALEVEDFFGWFWTAVVWPGQRRRFDGAPFEWPPGGEGPDEAWDFSVEALYQADYGVREHEAREAS
jgi:fatty acid desaturase